MGDKISDLPSSSTISSSDVLIKSNSAGNTEIITLDDFQKNFYFLRTTGSNTMQIGVSDYELPVMRIPSSNRYVGIGGGSSFVPSSVLHISGYTGQNTIVTIHPASGFTGYLKFHDNSIPWYLGNIPSGKFFVSGYSANIYQSSFNVQNDGRVLISDGSEYSVSDVESGINMQFFAKTGLRMSFDNNTNSNDIDFDYSGIQSDKDLYINYRPDASILSGTFVGLSGAVFVDHDNGLTRIGNNDDRVPDARLMVTNDTTNGTSYRTFLIEDVANPNMSWRKIVGGSPNRASITFDGTNQLYFGLNKSAGAISPLDPLIVDLQNKRIGFGVDPASTIDISGANNTVFTRYQCAINTLIMKYQLNEEFGSTTDEIFHTYSSGTNNNMIVGYKFLASNYYGDAKIPGNFFWQTGNTSNVYNSSRNVAELTDYGDLNIKRYYSTDNDFCQGKFLQIHRSSCTEYNTPVYLNLDNINYDYQTSGSLAYHNLCQLRGSVKGVDFTCQTNSGLSNGTGYLVFNRFADLQMTNVGGTTYVSGETFGSRVFFQLWNSTTNNYKNPSDIDLTNYCYVSGALTGQGFFNLKARRSNTTVNEKFNGAAAALDFLKFQNIGWVAYAVTGTTNPAVTPLSGAKNLNTMISYFIESDTDSEAGTYINQ